MKNVERSCQDIVLVIIVFLNVLLFNSLLEVSPSRTTSANLFDNLKTMGLVACLNWGELEGDYYIKGCLNHGYTALPLLCVAYCLMGGGYYINGSVLKTVGV